MRPYQVYERAIAVEGSPYNVLKAQGLEQAGGTISWLPIHAWLLTARSTYEHPTISPRQTVEADRVVPSQQSDQERPSVRQSCRFQIDRHP